VNRVDERFSSMGSEARVRLESESVSRAGLAVHAAEIRALLDEVESTLSRFRPDSELSALNRDPRAAVPASPLMRTLVGAARRAGGLSGGLVDATLLSELEDQGYRGSRASAEPASLDQALAAAPERRPAGARPFPGFAHLEVDDRGRVRRPPGLRLDSGGLGKGLAADLAAALLPPGVRFAISCGGDLALASPASLPLWGVAVPDARSGAELERIAVRSGGVATSGIQTRLWRREDGGFAHHLLDPRTGEPAWTGLISVTALARSALDAEVLAKTALLSGPARARRILRRRGGVLQHDSGGIEVIAALPVVRLPRSAVGAAA
jgi:FAD:protein FMN transferase